MSTLVVTGKTKLSGTIAVSGNKNEALPCIAASLLMDGPLTLENVPDIGDVATMVEIARKLGVSVSTNSAGAVTLNARTIKSDTLPLELSTRVRGSILFASSLLVRKGRVSIPQPGGDRIGRRRLDTHFLVFTALGARFRREGDGGEAHTYILEAPRGLRGTEIYLDEASVTATENAVIAAAGARGKTTIINAASEPHVQGLCRLFEAAGVRIDGIGSNILTVYGATHRDVRTHRIGGDYIEAGSCIGLAAATQSHLRITGAPVADMRMILHQFSRLGVSVQADPKKNELLVKAKKRLTVKEDIGGAVPKIEDSPWPGFPADLMPIMLVTATQARGTCLIHEKMFEARLFYVDRLIDMGARIVLCDPHRAVIAGPSALHGLTISSPDIRAGMALLIAALCAEGTSTIYNAEQIDRGYQRIDKRLAACGARIRRTAERRKRGT